MSKNKHISLVLLFVFSFVLVHNDIVHHHHDDISEIHSHEHHHHHDKKEKDHHNENNEPVGFFSHPTHILVSSEFVISADNSIQKAQKFNQFFQITDLVFKTIADPVKLKPPNYTSVIPLQLYYSKHTLRGPPTFSV
jgi:short subunit fatty acids transporter